MKKIKKIIYILIFSLIFTSCTTKEKKIKENNILKQKEDFKDYKKFTKGFFGTFDTEIVFSAYCKNEDEFLKYYSILENEMKRYHNLYNSFEDSNENNIKTINDNAEIKEVLVDREIIDLLEFSIDAYKNISKSNNIAIGNLTSLWKKEMEKAVDLNGKLPDDKKIKDALKDINIDNIVINREKNTVYIKNKKTKIDVGAVAKGYATEKVLNSLKEKGLKSAIISAGGNVKAIGHPFEKNKNKWAIGIQTPNYDGSVNDIKDVIYTDDVCAVTSGDYQRFYYVNGKMYNHIIDPKTGYPKNEIKSVTVVYKDSAICDFLSTSLFLNDVKTGKEILKKVKGSEAFWILKDGSVDFTDGMKKMLKSKGAINK